MNAPMKKPVTAAGSFQVFKGAIDEVCEAAMFHFSGGDVGATNQDVWYRFQKLLTQANDQILTGLETTVKEKTLVTVMGPLLQAATFKRTPQEIVGHFIKPLAERFARHPKMYSALEKVAATDIIINQTPALSAQVRSVLEANRAQA